jgi:hypothetical protein
MMVKLDLYKLSLSYSPSSISLQGAAPKRAQYFMVTAVQYCSVA